MKNYVQPGNTITLTAPYAVASGDGLLVGSIFGIASGAAAIGDTVELQGYFRGADGYFAADHTSFWGCKVG